MQMHASRQKRSHGTKVPSESLQTMFVFRSMCHVGEKDSFATCNMLPCKEKRTCLTTASPGKASPSMVARLTALLSDHQVSPSRHISPCALLSYALHLDALASRDFWGEGRKACLRTSKPDPTPGQLCEGSALRVQQLSLGRANTSLHGATAYLGGKSHVTLQSSPCGPCRHSRPLEHSQYW